MLEKTVIIGGGPGGYVAALRAARLGAEVTLVEVENIGGTCLNWGCIPSKIMKTAAETAGLAGRAKDLGVEITGTVTVNLNAVYNRMEKILRGQRDGIIKLLNNRKVRYVNGFASTVRPGLCMVKLSRGKELEVPWERLILATGSVPLDPPSIPVDHDNILLSNDMFNLKKIPESIIIIGGGIIGCEFAFIFNAFGSQVTIIEAFPRLLPLPSVDEDCSKVLQREMKKLKIDFFVNTTVERAEKVDGMIRVTAIPSLPDGDDNSKNGEMRQLEAEKVLVCVGRSPATSVMGLEDLGVNRDEKGWILANERMETHVPGIYAVGDVLGPSRIMLAHVAFAEGMIAAENAAGAKMEMDYKAVPNAIFTMPEIANVGLTGVQALEKGYRARADRMLFRSIGKPHIIGEIAGEAKIVSDITNGKILGIHIIGPRATDLIAEGVLALKMGCTVKDLTEAIHAHPTLSEIISETANMALDRPLLG